MWLSKKKTNLWALALEPDLSNKTTKIKLLFEPTPSEIKNGTVKKGSAICPHCNYVTPVQSVRKQLKNRNGGTNDAQLLCLVVTDSKKRKYRLPIKEDLDVLKLVENKLMEIKKNSTEKISLVPDEEVNPLPHSVNRLPLYGMNTWGDVYTNRQLLAILTLIKKINSIPIDLIKDIPSEVIRTVLALAIDRCADYWSSLATWAQDFVSHAFGRQALPFITDFAEVSAISDETGSWIGAVEWISNVIKRESCISQTGQAVLSDATDLPLADNSIQLFATDPPYYDSVSYADLSDYFYVWLKRSIRDIYPSLLSFSEAPKQNEIIVEPTFVKGIGKKDNNFYLDRMFSAMKQCKRILTTDGIGILVFAHKSTSGWGAQLESMVNSGLSVTASWPIDTERPGKVSGIGQARLVSSIHLVCRPREENNIGDWRDVLQELPKRIHEWMPRLSDEGVVGADAIFACLGPALEIFSQYSSVEKPNGDIVTLVEYLEQVWAAVAKEGLNMIFSGADTSSFEPDARLTAMWLWTLGSGSADSDGDNQEETYLEDEEDGKKTIVTGGFKLESDAARKIAQGLGANLEQLTSLIEVKGSEARLLPVSERTEYLLGLKGRESEVRQKKVTKKQLTMFEAMEEIESFEHEGVELSGTFKKGKTVLDQVHQSMILFAAGKGDTMKRFLTDEGVGTDERFWKLAQSLSSLYPSGTDEKRWVDGVLARKKGLGF